MNYNWYKKAQMMTKQDEWERFKNYPSVPWFNVLILNVGNPTEEEKAKIIEKGLMDEEIDPSDEYQFPKGTSDEYQFPKGTSDEYQFPKSKGDK